MGGIDRTFLMVKPDGVQRGLVGEILSRVEDRGLRVSGLKMLTVDRETAEEHYEEHSDKGFFDSLVSYITSGPSVAMVLEGREAVPVVRSIIGATDPADAAPGTVRGDFALDLGRNVVHAADSDEAAEREIGLYFDEGEVESYELDVEDWIYE